MSRVKVNLPASFQFSANYTVRVSDLNYGNHLGNDRLLSILHQARIDFISHLCNGSELDFFGVSLIMADVVINYQNEAFLNDLLTIDMALANPTRLAVKTKILPQPRQVWFVSITTKEKL